MWADIRQSDSSHSIDWRDDPPQGVRAFPQNFLQGQFTRAGLLSCASVRVFSSKSSMYFVMARRITQRWFADSISLPISADGLRARVEVDAFFCLFLFLRDPCLKNWCHERLSDRIVFRSQLPFGLSVSHLSYLQALFRCWAEEDPVAWQEPLRRRETS